MDVCGSGRACLALHAWSGKLPADRLHSHRARLRRVSPSPSSGEEQTSQQETVRSGARRFGSPSRLNGGFALLGFYLSAFRGRRLIHKKRCRGSHPSRGWFFGSWLTPFRVPVALRRRIAPGLPFSGVSQEIKNTGCACCASHASGSWLTAFAVPVVLRRRVTPVLPFRLFT